MDYFSSNYRIVLDGTSVPYVIGDDFRFEWEKFEDSFYFRRKLADKVKLRGSQYRYIDEAPANTRFTFVLQKRNLSTGLYEDDFTGFFYKTNCDFDADYEIVEVEVQSDDGYEDVNRVLNNEYNLIDITQNVTPIKYDIKPIYQVLVNSAGVNLGRTTLVSRIGNTFWSEDIEEVDFDDYVNVYGFRRTDVGSPLLEYTYWERYLTTADLFNGVATTDRPANDLSSVNLGYNKISTEFYSVINTYFSPGTATQPTPTEYGQVETYCASYPNYFSGPFGFPIAIDAWICTSYWSIFTNGIIDYENTNAEQVTLNDAYSIQEAVQSILSQETAIVFSETEDYSEFLYAASNPITGVAPVYNFITQKSNVINAKYTVPASKALVRLSEIMDMLRKVYNAYWFIETVEGERRMRIEHVSFFEKGGSYGSNNISIDLTNTFDKRNGKPLSFHQNKFTYNLANMPQRYEFAWSDETGVVFRGQPMDILDEQINPGDIVRNKVDLFTTDIDILVSLNNPSLDGFCLFGCEFVSPDYVVLKRVIDGFEFQNGDLTFTHLVPTYLKYDLPAENVSVNGAATTADSITRNKQQEVEFALENLEIDPLNLITTGIGDGQVEKMSLNLISNNYVITLNHDTE